MTSRHQKGTAQRCRHSIRLGLLLGLVLFSLSVPAGAQSLEGLPGFVDFEDFGDFDLDDLRVEINLSQNLINLLSSAVEEEDGEFSELLRDLNLIKVNIFELEDETESATRRLRSTVRDLRNDGWESVVSIRDGDTINLMIRTDGELIFGLFGAWAGESGDLGLINIVGNFDPQQIARLARQLNIASLEDLDLGQYFPEEDEP